IRARFRPGASLSLPAGASVPALQDAIDPGALRPSNGLSLPAGGSVPVLEDAVDPGALRSDQDTLGERAAAAAARADRPARDGGHRLARGEHAARIAVAGARTVALRPEQDPARPVGLDGAQ